MQMIFTLEELKQMDTEELIKLAYFGNDKEYLLSNISRFQHPFTIIMNDGSKLECETLDILNDHKRAKLKYDLLSSTLAGINSNNASKENLREEIHDAVNEQVTNLEKTIAQIAEDAINIFSVSERSMANSTAKVRNIMDTMETSFTSKMRKIDAEKFGPKMQKVDNIIKAFEDLLS